MNRKVLKRVMFFVVLVFLGILNGSTTLAQDSVGESGKSKSEQISKKSRNSRAANAIRERGSLTTYSTLADAISNVPAGSVLEITDDFNEPAHVTVDKDITLISIGNNEIDLDRFIIDVKSGASLTLGNGSTSDILTIVSSTYVIRVLDGYIDVKDGIELKAKKADKKYCTSLSLEGANASGKISGGALISDSIALQVKDGAVISQISGGEFHGHNSSLDVVGNNSRIDFITDGIFKNDPNNTLIRANAYVQHGGAIGEISGGKFNAESSAGLFLLRGGWVDKISGGEFTSNDSDTVNNNLVGYGLAALSYDIAATGISEITDGKFNGEIGLWVQGKFSEITKFSGGDFSGLRAIQVGEEAEVGVFDGAKISGTYYGIFNVAKINKIQGNTEVSGEIGIWNYWDKSEIDSIDGGKIIGSDRAALVNAGTISSINGGVFIGEKHAIECYSATTSYPQKIDVIHDGVFYGKTKEAIFLKNKVKLEPSLISGDGVGRYWGKDGVIFNDKSLVEFPQNYIMSTNTKPVTGITTTDFKYLTFALKISYDKNGGIGTMTPTLGEANTLVQSAKNKFKRNGYVFTGWNTQANGNGTSYPDNSRILLSSDMKLYAQWKKQDKTPKPGPGSSEKDGKPGIDKRRKDIPNSGDNHTLMITLAGIGVLMSCLFGIRNIKLFK